jgi:hypothetical protein
MRIERTFLAVFLLCDASAHATTYAGDPSNYLTLLASLKPGDTLQLAGGTYTGLLQIDGLNGNPCQWITIEGPASGTPATFPANACCNTAELTNASYLALVNLTFDGQHQTGLFAISAKGGNANLVHDVRVEGCTILNHDGDQQTDGISTKTPTWGWVIRGNTIDSVGTGLYLGNSDGSDPFVAGLIEDNLVENPIGYDMEIKQQNPWPAVPGLPPGPHTTVIRHNVFMKNDQPSPDGDRPNVLTDNYPACGAGSLDRYEIYGNFFFHNPRESLLQLSGNFTVHDNLFVDDTGRDAIAVQNHAGSPVIQAWIYDNTFYSVTNGIVFYDAATVADGVVGNLVFSPNPIQGPIGDQRDNVVDQVGDAGLYVRAPSLTLGAMDFHPLAGEAAGPAMDMSKFTGDTDEGLDFDGLSRGTFTARGAYATAGPGWTPAAALQPGTFVDAGPCAGFDGGQTLEPVPDNCDGGAALDAGSGPSDAGGRADAGSQGSDGGSRDAGATTSQDAGASGGTGGTGGSAPMHDGGTGVAAPSGCGCTEGPGLGSAWLWIVAALVLRRGAGLDSTPRGRRRVSPDRGVPGPPLRLTVARSGRKARRADP